MLSMSYSCTSIICIELSDKLMLNSVVFINNLHRHSKFFLLGVGVLISYIFVPILSEFVPFVVRWQLPTSDVRNIGQMPI